MAERIRAVPKEDLDPDSGQVHVNRPEAYQDYINNLKKNHYEVKIENDPNGGYWIKYRREEE
jgi:hypothetical protein